VLPYQRLAQKGFDNQFRPLQAKFWPAYSANIVSFAPPILLPAMGYSTFTIRPGESGIPTRHPEIPGIADCEPSMENEFLHPGINLNDSLVLIGKYTQERCHRFHIFEDITEIGYGA
jgi:hypothetical protein